MEELLSKFGYSGFFGIIWMIFLIRYLLFSGIVFLIVWVFLGKKLSHKLIQGKRPEKKKIIHEVKYSLITFLVFALSGVFIAWSHVKGYNLIYENVGDYGFGYLIFSAFVLILLHDTYFYWTHRMMHHKFSLNIFILCIISPPILLLGRRFHFILWKRSSNPESFRLRRLCFLYIRE
ncbi:hypothetical protein LEP1GSC043_4182 [Leptospira weilii str. Ecochallenge]|uniref:Uncharacterized protein n=1 Tax=Leptospira weilii str. Ecochallenge TaxID=1049986 RepID=N1UDX6_9LEPT|nr:hypothetical protein LEP1GSC043_4182 [Leptospira weilii str. Ecochallenge]